MVDNDRRELRGPVRLQEIKPDGSVTVAYGEESRALKPGEPWIIRGPKEESQLVVYYVGRWRSSGITYGESP